MKEIRIECGSSDIEVSIFTSQEFNGMVYPKGLAKNSTCMTEYTGQGSPVRYRLSLRSCNTMGVQQVSSVGVRRYQLSLRSCNTMGVQQVSSVGVRR